MTLEQLSTILQKTKYPVAFQAFPQKNAPAMPYICYEVPQANNFFADGIVFFSASRAAVILYTAKRDLTAEQTVESIFNASKIPWTKDAVFNELQRCYEIEYEIEV